MRSRRATRETIGRANDERLELVMTLLASSYPFLNIFWTMLIFFFWVIWIWIVVTVLIDVFSRHDLSGWGKAGWTVFVIILPFLGVLVYLIAQGSEMTERRTA
jgi:Phospholipase_D-nuclease N-terminal